MSSELEPASGPIEQMNTADAAVGAVPLALSMSREISRQDGEPGSADVMTATDDETFMVGWDGPDDKCNPRNWSPARKWYLTGAAGFLVLNATFSSSAPAGIMPDLQKEFGMPDIVATLTISLFVAGYCVGPILWGPLSEQFGRRPIFILSFVVYTAFQVGNALSRSTAQILVFRFLGGTFAACPLTNSGAVVADIMDAKTRAQALAIYTIAPFAGPALGPIVSGYLNAAGVDWRWLFWVLTIFAGACIPLIVFTMPETYGPALLCHKAAALRKKTGDNRYWAPLERRTTRWQDRVYDVLVRPFLVLFSEKMVMAMALYMAFIYGILYLEFLAYPIVFVQGHGFSEGESGLMFLPLFVGGVLGVVVYLAVFRPRYDRWVEEFAPEPVPPEYRLEVAMWSGPIYSISFFWFGWTSYPWISYWAPAMSGVALGAGTGLIFLSLFNYIIDTYLMLAATTLAGLSVSRSIAGAAFPLFARQMYTALDPRIASTILGCISLAMVPIPFILSKYGARLRKGSKYSSLGHIMPGTTKK